MKNFNSMDKSQFLTRAFLWEIFEFDTKLFRFCAGIFLVLYGYELFSFTLSIDEEMYSSALDNDFNAWVSQGRWGMALLGAMLPPISSIPVISTSIFGIGLIFSALHFAKTFQLDAGTTIVFCGVFVLSPIWPHIVEFNTLSYGIGVGLASIALGTRLMLRKGIIAFFLTAMLWAFAVAIYQSFLFLGALVLCVSAISSVYLQGEPASMRENINNIRKGMLLLLLTLGFYLAIQIGFNKTFKVGITYINDFDYIGAYHYHFTATFQHALKKSLAFLLGTGDIYLGWGKIIVALPLIGFLGLCYAALSANNDRRSKISFVVLVSLLVIAALVPFFVFAGHIAARTVVWFPLLFAALSAFAMKLVKFRAVVWALFVANIIACSFISNSLFYFDHLARVQDTVLATNLIQRINSKLEAQANIGHVRFAVVGEHHSSIPVKEIEVFGASFFSWDQGNVLRVNAYLKILGMTNLDSVEVMDMSMTEIDRANSMPVWPHSGSVAWVDDLLVLKMSELSPNKHNLLCKKHKDWAYCNGI